MENKKIYYKKTNETKTRKNVKKIEIFETKIEVQLKKIIRVKNPTLRFLMGSKKFFTNIKNGLQKRRQ